MILLCPVQGPWASSFLTELFAVGYQVSDKGPLGL